MKGVHPANSGATADAATCFHASHRTLFHGSGPTGFNQAQGGI